jgi:hypothetical protein
MDEAIEKSAEHFWLLIATRSIEIHFRVKNVLFEDSPWVVLPSYHISEELEICAIVSIIARYTSVENTSLHQHSLVVSEVVSKILTCNFFGRFECRALVLAVQFVCRLYDVAVSSQGPERNGEVGGMAVRRIR